MIFGFDMIQVDDVSRLFRFLDTHMHDRFEHVNDSPSSIR